jgi:methyl-accepting chemotaxis protein
VPATQHAKVSERVAAATEELASGLAEASASAEQLRRAMEQIAAGGEEAAGASQEQLAAVKNIVASLATARDNAEACRQRTAVVRSVLAETAGQITTSVRAIERNATRQQSSVRVIAELERRAQEIGEITLTIGKISDQTNLLALNAAIEAARPSDRKPAPRTPNCWRKRSKPQCATQPSRCERRRKPPSPKARQEPRWCKCWMRCATTCSG